MTDSGQDPPAGKVVVPDELAASQALYFGDAGRLWVAALPGLAADLVERWRLRRDGEAVCGAVALVLPVVRADGTLAVLKLQPVDDETGGEVMALKSWAGRGAVRVLEDDPHSGSMLLERLDASRSLRSLPDDLAAVQVIARLLVRLNAVQAPTGLRRLADLAGSMLEHVPSVLGSLADPAERKLLDRCAASVRELLTDPVDDRLLHWDLHYDNVLAPLSPEQQEPWLAIDPKPLSGDPGFELLPALWNRWDDVVATGDPTRAVLRRFDLMVDTLGLSWERARVWTLARVLQNAVWDLGRFSETALHPSHRCIVESLLSRGG